MEHCQDHINCMERITKTEESVKSAHHRLDEVFENQKILIEMNTNIKLLAQQYQTHGDKLDVVEADVKELKDKPAKRWDSLTLAFAVSLASGLAGALLGMIIK